MAPYQCLDESYDTHTTPPHRKPFLTPCRAVSAILAVVFLMGVIFQAQILAMLGKVHFGECGEAPTRLVLFREHLDLQDAGAVGDMAWKGLLPPDTPYGYDGIIFVPINESFTLPYEVSYNHALHCLNALRTEIFHGQPGALQQNRKTRGHMGHCLSYVAQHVLCSADDTIERVKPPRDALGHYLPESSTGQEERQELHTCRDRSQTDNIVHELTNANPKTLRYPEPKRKVDRLDVLFEECPECFFR